MLRVHPRYRCTWSRRMACSGDGRIHKNMKQGVFISLLSVVLFFHVGIPVPLCFCLSRTVISLLLFLCLVFITSASHRVFLFFSAYFLFVTFSLFRICFSCLYGDSTCMQSSAVLHPCVGFTLQAAQYWFCGVTFWGMPCTPLKQLTVMHP